MMKMLLATLLTVSLTTLPAAEAHAQSREDRNNTALAGVVALGLLGLALNSSGDVDITVTETKPRARAPQQSRSVFAQPHRAARPVLLPSRCFRRVENARGAFHGVFLKDCLERRYHAAHRLPRDCAMRVGGRDGRRHGYDARCLRDYGYRADHRFR